jgi:hypothetical protein
MQKDIKTPKLKSIEIEDWDLTQSFGILPDNISLTKNIGCVGGKSKKENFPKITND